MNALLLTLAVALPSVDFSAMTAEWSAPTLQQAVEKVTVIDAYAPSWCSGCKPIKKETDGNGAVEFRWHSNEKEFPSWVPGVLNQPGSFYPVFHWRNSSGVEAHFSLTWPGLHGFLRVVDKHEFARPIIKQPAMVQRSYSGGYPVRGSWWTGCGSWRHMTGGEHSGKFDATWLSSLSWAELQSLHSDDHEHRVKWSYVVRPGQSVQVRAPQQRAAQDAYCPNCPNGRRTIRSRQSAAIGVVPTGLLIGLISLLMGC